MKPLTLKQFIESDTEDALLQLRCKGVLPPQVTANLRRLSKLDLLTDEVVMSLIGQAPIDPIGLFGALKDSGVWAFQPINFTAVQVLAKQGPRPVAVMQLDLISDAVTFVVFDKEQLVEHRVLSPDEIVNEMKKPGMNEARMLAWLQGFMKDAVEVGLKNAS